MTLSRAVALSLLAVLGCAGSTPWVPAASPVSAQDVVLVWVGRGECELYVDGQWVRRPELDYEFSVEQRRLPGRWESIKSLVRRHPDYDGSAGERALTYFFELEVPPVEAATELRGSIRSSLGDGAWSGDRQFRHAVVELAADVSRWAPFDRYRITQDYLYEEGRLIELVELNSGDRPWVRNREQATLYAPGHFDGAPVRR